MKDCMWELGFMNCFMSCSRNCVMNCVMNCSMNCVMNSSRFYLINRVSTVLLRVGGLMACR